LFGRLLRSLVAAIVLTALVGALPWALVHYVGGRYRTTSRPWPDLQGFLITR